MTQITLKNPIGQGRLDILLRLLRSWNIDAQIEEISSNIVKEPCVEYATTSNILTKTNERKIAIFKLITNNLHKMNKLEPLPPLFDEILSHRVNFNTALNL
jgi:hypothetical protein